MPKSKITDSELIRIINTKQTALQKGPTKLNCCYDRSCNLKCASCRSELIMHKKFSFDWNRAHQIQQQLAPLLQHLEWLEITGSGDPFASSIFFELLQSIQSNEVPNLKIFLHTNATLWNQERWMKLSGIHHLIKKVDISIDAATAKTYQVVRSGGDFNSLMKNLTFISCIRSQGLLDDLKLSFVVQSENFYEIPAFIELGKRFQVDRVLFSMIDNWGTFDDQAYSARAVHLPEHPLHGKLLDVINDVNLDHSFCDFSNLSHLLRTR